MPREPPWISICWKDTRKCQHEDILSEICLPILDISEHFDFYHYCLCQQWIPEPGPYIKLPLRDSHTDFFSHFPLTTLKNILSSTT